MRNPKDFFKPMAIGAPEPAREIPFRPSRMIHFFDPSNPKMAAKAPSIAAKCDVLLGNLEDAIQADNKTAAREGFVKIAKENDFGDCQLWTRVNSLDSPWFLDDMQQIVGEVGDKVDVIMVPKVEGPWDIHYVDRLLAQLEARAGVKRPILVHAILETALGVANVEEIAGASPRMQGLSLGPAGPRGIATNEDDARRWWAPRLPRARGSPCRRSRSAPGHGAARPLALHDRAHGRCVCRERHLRVLRPVRRHP
jgi:malyl-CoA/(S)-citramalyl-CoA lyase